MESFVTLHKIPSEVKKKDSHSFYEKALLKM